MPGNSMLNILIRLLFAPTVSHCSKRQQLIHSPLNDFDKYYWVGQPPQSEEVLSQAKQRQALWARLWEVTRQVTVSNHHSQKVRSTLLLRGLHTCTGNKGWCLQDHYQVRVQGTKLKCYEVLLLRFSCFVVFLLSIPLGAIRI